MHEVGGCCYLVEGITAGASEGQGRPVRLGEHEHSGRMAYREEGGA
jgi:hypothetical protein